MPNRPKRRRPLTREDLIHRYARVRGLTYPAAFDAAADVTDEVLRAAVEDLERKDAPGGAHAAFRSSTTQAQGIAR